MMTLDYNTVIGQASDDVEKSKRDMPFIFGSLSLFSFLFSFKHKAIAKTFSYQLVISKWLLTDMTANYESIVGVDLVKMISLINKLVKLNIEMQADIEQQLNKVGNKQAELTVLNSEIQEAIANLYSCLRLLKKATKKSSNEPSALAISAAARSANSIKSIYAGH